MGEFNSAPSRRFSLSECARRSRASGSRARDAPARRPSSPPGEVARGDEYEREVSSAPSWPGQIQEPAVLGIAAACRTAVRRVCGPMFMMMSRRPALASRPSQGTRALAHAPASRLRERRRRRRRGVAESYVLGSASCARFRCARAYGKRRYCSFQSVQVKRVPESFGSER